MLKEIFTKREVSEEEKKRKLNREISLFGIIFIFAILVFMFGDIVKTPKEKDVDKIDEVKKETVVELFDKINDNYSLVIEKNENDVISSLKYARDKSIILLESKDDVLDQEGYMIYNQKMYYLKDGVLHETQKINYKIEYNAVYYDISFIKTLLKSCKMEEVDSSQINCKLKVSDFLKEYNYKYDTSYKIMDDKDFILNILYSTSSIKSIKIDYSEINKILTAKDENNIIIYNIKINDIGTNNFEENISKINLK